MRTVLGKYFYHTVTWIWNMYTQNTNSATSNPNTNFIFPKQIFIILCGLFYQWGWKLESWLWSVSCPNNFVLYISSWNFQMLAAEQLLAGQAAWVALPSIHHGKNHSYWATILQLSWPGRESGSNPFFCPPPPPINTCVLYTATFAAHRTYAILLFQYF